jgi:hypothetical protein
MRESKNVAGVLIAYNKGYRVTDSGEVIKDGNKRSCACNSKGYLGFNIRGDYDGKRGVSFNVKVHQLVAYQKFGEKALKKGICVRHLDGDSKNNTSDNIAIGTMSDNMMDIPKEVRVAKALHATSFVRKYDKNAVNAFYQECKSYKKTMAEFGIGSKGTLHHILKSVQK